MKTMFSKKTNKKAVNTIFQVKTQIRTRADNLRHHEQRYISPLAFDDAIDSELFRRYSVPSEFEVVGREPGL